MNYTEEEVWDLLLKNTENYLDWIIIILKNPEKAWENKPNLSEWFELNKKNENSIY